jgi:autotransporter-associated beta strand protein
MKKMTAWISLKQAVVALVLLAVSSHGQSTNFFWTNLATSVESWSAANWTNAAVTPAVPLSGGAPSYILNFAANTGTYTANNDLGTFTVNQLLVNTGTVTLGGSGLVLTNNGTVGASIGNTSGQMLTINNALELGAGVILTAGTTNSITLNGIISGSGNLTNSGSGTFILAGNNTYTNTTVVRGTGSALAGQGRGLVLSNTTGGVAINGNINLGGGGSANTYLRLGANEQIVDTSVITFNTTANHGRFMLLGQTETIAGLQTTSGRGVVENTDANDTANNYGPATLILSPTAGNTYSFNGYMRNYFTGGASNTLALVKNGDGTQVLVGVNIGNIAAATVNAGVLVLTNTTTWGSPVTINGGQLQLHSGTALNYKSVTNNAANGLGFYYNTAYSIGGLGGTGSLILTNNTGAAVALTLGGGGANGDFSGDISGAGSLIKAGAGWQVLSGNNTYLGTTTVSSGALEAATTSALPGFSTPGMVSVSTASVLAVRAALWSQADIDTLVANTTWDPGSFLGLSVTSGSHTYGNPFSGTLGLAKVGGGTLVLTATNTYAGGTMLAGGTLSVGSYSNLPAGPLVFNNGGILKITGAEISDLNSYTFASGFNGGFEIENALTVTNDLIGGGGLVKQGAGTLLLTGANTYTGGTTNQAGLLQAGSTSALGNGAALVLNGGMVDLGAYATPLGSLIGVAGTSITNNGGMSVTQNVDATFAGIITGSGGFTKAGAKVLTLTGANTYTGLTTVNTGAGALVLSNTTGQALQGPVQVGNAAGNTFLVLGVDEQLSDTEVVSFGGGNAQYGRFLLLGHTETIGGLNDSSGTNGIVENNDNTGAFGEYATNAGPSTLILNVAAGTNFAFKGYMRSRGSAVGPSNTLSLVKTGLGSQTLGGANISASGNNALAAITVQQGTLILTNTSINTPVTVSGGQLLLQSSTAMNNNSITNNAANGLGFEAVASVAIGGLTGNGSIALTNETGAAVALKIGSNNANGTYTGEFSGSGSVTKNGTGAQFLSAASSYTGDTTNNAGTLRMGADNVFGSGTFVQSGGTLASDGATTRTLTNAFTVAQHSTFGQTSGGTGSLLLNGPIYNGTASKIWTINNPTTVVNGVISGTGDLTKSGPGLLLLTAINDFAGNVTNSTGSLVVNGNLGGLVTTLSGATLGGTGTLGVAVLNTGSTLSPGNSPGTLTVTNLTLNNNTNLFELVNATSFDQVLVANTGSLSLTNSPFLRLTLTNFTASAGDKFLIFDNQFATTPFDKAADGNLRLLDEVYGLGNPLELTNSMVFSAMGGGVGTTTFQIFYDANGLLPDHTGNDILLTVIPEPASFNLLVMLGAAYWLRRRLHSRQRRWDI